MGQFNMGLIPPPRSFSDNNELINSTTNNKSNNNNVNSSLHNSIDSESSILSDKIEFDESGDSNYSSNKGTIPVCIIKSTNDGKLVLSTEFLEEVPTKVPQINAMPKKSAMKKARVDNQTKTTDSSTNGSVTNSSSSIIFANKFTKFNSYTKNKQEAANYKVNFPELKSVIKGLKSNPNSINIQCK